MSRAVMQQALEALEGNPISHAGLVNTKHAITALRAALAEPEQGMSDTALKLAEWIESDMSCEGDAEIAAELRRLHALNAELLEALKHAAECVQTNYLPDKMGRDWDDVIQRAEASK